MSASNGDARSANEKKSGKRGRRRNGDYRNDSSNGILYTTSNYNNSHNNSSNNKKNFLQRMVVAVLLLTPVVANLLYGAFVTSTWSAEAAARVQQAPSLAHSNKNIPPRIHGNTSVSPTQIFTTNDPSTTNTTTALVSNRIRQTPYDYNMLMYWYVSPVKEPLGEVETLPDAWLCKYRNRIKTSLKDLVLRKTKWSPVATTKGNNNNSNTSNDVPPHILGSQDSRKVSLTKLAITCREVTRPYPVVSFLEEKSAAILSTTPWGSEDWMAIFYAFRLTAAGSVVVQQAKAVVTDFVVGCKEDYLAYQNDSNQTLLLHDSRRTNRRPSHDMVLPWSLGTYLSVPDWIHLEEYWGPLLLNQEYASEPTCTTLGFHKAPIGWAVPWIRQDLRRMAVALLGLPPPSGDNENTAHHHPIHQWVERQTSISNNPIPGPNPKFVETFIGNGEEFDYTKSLSELLSSSSSPPILPDIATDLDEVVIHIQGGGKTRYIRFGQVASLLLDSNTTGTSIGILPQCSHPSTDMATTVEEILCQSIAKELKQFLQDAFPNARVRVHKEFNEQPTAAYARLVLAAKQTISLAASSLSLFPVVGAIHHGYYYLVSSTSESNSTDNKGDHHWLNSIYNDLLLRDSKDNFADGKVTKVDIEPNDVLSYKFIRALYNHNETLAHSEILKFLTLEDYEIDIDLEMNEPIDQEAITNKNAKKLVRKSVGVEGQLREDPVDVYKRAEKIGRSYNYSLILDWNIPPTTSDFKVIPFKQFCRWRNHKKKFHRDKIVREENWRPVYVESTDDGESTSRTISGNLDLQQHILRNAKQGNRTAAISKVSVDDKPFWLLHMKMDCLGLLKQSSFGTGNWVQMLYLLRLSAAGTFNAKVKVPAVVDFLMTCIEDSPSRSSKKMGLIEADEAAKSLVTPWATGHFSSSGTLKYLYEYWGGAHPGQRCDENAWGGTPAGWTIPLVRQDFRRMALALVGLPKDDPSHPVYTWLKYMEGEGGEMWNQIQGPSFFYTQETLPDTPYTKSISQLVSTDFKPLLPDVELDDAVIHFRCGDIMAANHAHFRFLKFREFSSRLKSDVRSMGIVTQAFTVDKDDRQSRGQDMDDQFRMSTCKNVVLSFVRYLEERFPNARVSVHNGPGETVALAYARLIMARQAFAWPDSSFSIYPAIACFGTGYHMYPVASPYTGWTPKNYWMIDIAEPIERADAAKNYQDGKIEFLHIGQYDALYSPQTKQMRFKNETQAAKDIVEWFANDTMYIYHDVDDWKNNQRKYGW